MMPFRYNALRICSARRRRVRARNDSRARVIQRTARRTRARRSRATGRFKRPLEGNTLVIETTELKGGHAPTINLPLSVHRRQPLPQSDQLKTTERITRLNNDMWLYEIKTEDPVILTGPFTVRYPMKNDPSYEWWEYACHEGNTIVPNYTNTSRHERANPPKEPVVPAVELTTGPPQQAAGPIGSAPGATPTATVKPFAASGDITKALTGRWVGRPQLKTIDYDIEIEFTANPDGAWSEG